MPRFSPLPRFAPVLLACAALVQAAHAEVTLSLDSVSGNVGEVVEVGLRVATSGGDVPTAMVLFLSYDAARVAPAAGFYGAGSGPAQAAPALTAAGKQIDAAVFPEGVVSLAILGAGATAIPNGLVLNLAFEILAGAPSGISVAIDGREAGEPVLVNGEDSFSTAANAASQGLTLRFNDGAVIIGCTPRAATPTGLSASTGRADGVLLTWTGVAEAGATYRVFRAGVNDFSVAQPLGTGFATATNFLDTTAAAPELPAGSGCACPAPEAELTTYFYWVVARTAAGCGGDPAGPAQGSRGEAKTLPATGEATLEALPTQAGADGIRAVGATDPVALRLPDAAGDLVPWAEIPELDRAAYRLERVARDDDGLWVRAVPVGRWPEGARFHLRAGARARDGRSVGPVAHAFAVAAGDSTPDPRIEAADPAAYPYLEVGTNAVWRLGPETVYDAPRAFLIPVPADEDARALRVYLHADGGTPGWYPAERVRGWLAAPTVLERAGGRDHFRVSVWHGGVVQLGTEAPARAEAPAASLPLPWGDATVLALAILGMLAAARLGRARRDA